MILAASFPPRLPEMSLHQGTVNMHTVLLIFKESLCRELEASALTACSIHGTPPPLGANLDSQLGCELERGHLEEALYKELHSWHHCPEVHKAIDGVRFIADHTRREEDSTRVSK